MGQTFEAFIRAGEGLASIHSPSPHPLDVCEDVLLPGQSSLERFACGFLLVHIGVAHANVNAAGGARLHVQKVAAGAPSSHP